MQISKNNNSKNQISKEFKDKFRLPKWLINDLQKDIYPDCSDEFNHDTFCLCYLSQEKDKMNQSEKDELDYLDSEFFKLTKEIPEGQSGLNFNNDIEKLYFCRIPNKIDPEIW